MRAPLLMVLAGLLGACASPAKQGPGPAVEIDHVFVFTERDAPEQAVLRGAGLVVHPRSLARHAGQGTTSFGVFFHNAYLELIWVDDPQVASAASRQRLRYDTLDRARWRTTGASPFGIGLRHAGGATTVPFRTFEYRAEWMPDGTKLDIAESASDTSEPLTFVEPDAFVSPPLDAATGAGPAWRWKFAAHPAGMQRLTKVSMGVRDPADVSDALRVLVQQGVLSLERSPHPLVTLSFDGERQGKVTDLRPALPVILRY